MSVLHMAFWKPCHKLGSINKVKANWSEKITTLVHQGKTKLDSKIVRNVVQLLSYMNIKSSVVGRPLEQRRK